MSGGVDALVHRNAPEHAAKQHPLPDTDEQEHARQSYHGAMPGDIVEICGLVSEEGKTLNGLNGIVLSYHCSTQRHSVRLKVQGRKRLRIENLVVKALPQSGGAGYDPPPSSPAVRSTPTTISPEAAFRVSSDDMAVQAAIEASLQDGTCTDPSEGSLHINAVVGEALLKGQSVPPPFYVLLLTYSRSPRSFRDALMQSPELSECRRALDSAGFQVELPTGAKVLVHPYQRLAAMEAIRLAGLRLAREHVVVSPDLENSVKQVVAHLPKRDKVYQRGSRSRVLPLGLAEQAVSSPMEICVSRTFIEIKLSSSMCSGTHSTPHTASTADADARKPRNPRRKGTAGPLEAS